MFSFFILFVTALASVHSFTFVAATPEPQITPAPPVNPNDNKPADGSNTDPILSTVRIPYSELPFMVNPYKSVRGPQSGYNQCNSSTEGPDSMCQTLIVNSIDDFCLWGSPKPNQPMGDVEASVVVYCTKRTHGSRPIRDGAITGVQYMKTSAYLQISGFISNTALDMPADDAGGELDPHGADFRGNPVGGLVYSNSMPDAINGAETQVINWNYFVGSGIFCLKLCYNNITEPDYCENEHDVLGCAYNMPSRFDNGTFTQCDGALQDVVGVYSVDGVTHTYQPRQSESPTPPYQPRVPASSNCKAFQSTELFGVPTSSQTSGSVKPTGTGSSGSGSSGSSGTSSQSSSTSTSSSALNSIGFPPAFFTVVLGLIAGVALVL